jgi:hypothetical protein
MSSFISLSVEPSNLTAAGSGMRTPLMPPARPRAQLRHEASWRGMPQERADDPAPHGAHAIVLARWTTSSEGEGNAIGPQGYYVIALSPYLPVGGVRRAMSRSGARDAHAAGTPCVLSIHARQRDPAAHACARRSAR